MRALEKASLFGMDITPRAEYRAHIEYLNNKVSGLKLSLAQEREATESWKDKCMTQENELIGVRACKAGIRQKNVKLQEEAVNLRSGMEKLKQDLNKAEDRAQEYKDKFTLKSQELTELEAIRERESKQYEERIAKLERELRMQEQAYIEIATVHDEDKGKLDALMEATGCTPYPVVNIDKPIPSLVGDVIIFDVVSAADKITDEELPGMATVEEAQDFVDGMNAAHEEVQGMLATADEDKVVTQEELGAVEKQLFYGDDDGAYDLGEDEPTEVADEEPLPSSPLYEGKKTKRNKKHKR